MRNLNIFKLIILIMISSIMIGCSNSYNELKVDTNISVDNKDKKDKSLEKDNIEKNKNINNQEVKHKDGENDPINNSKSNNSETKNKLKAIKIVIDPGHSKNAGNEQEKVSPNLNEKKLKDTVGSTGVKSKKAEYQIVNEIALELEKNLKNIGYTVFMTKRDANQNMSNIERAEFGNEKKADLVLRLHCDSVDSQSAKGASALIPSEKGYMTKDISAISKKYGEKIINIYTKEAGIKNRGIVYRNDLTGFNWSKVPVVLLEMGFLSNPDEDMYLSNKNNYKDIANSIAEGINSIFK